VYAAIDTHLNRRVALKVLNADLVDHPTARARMEIEAKALAGISHPNVVKINNVLTVDRSLTLELELVTGGTLAQRIASGPIPAHAAIRIMTGVLSGLDAIHGAGLIHRDMKPANVLMTENGEPKIADLGIAHQRDGERITRTGASLGTPEYMSPEQVRGLPVSRATDIYACGVILYEMLRGMPPFEGTSEYDVAEAHVNQPPNLTALQQWAPPSLIHAVAKALEKQPERRWRTALELRAALQSAIDAPAQPLPLAPVPQTPEPHAETREGTPPPPRRSHFWQPARLGIAGAVGLVLVGLAALGLIGVVMAVAVFLLADSQAPAPTRKPSPTVTQERAPEPAPTRASLPDPPDPSPTPDPVPAPTKKTYAHRDLLDPDDEFDFRLGGGDIAYEATTVREAYREDFPKGRGDELCIRVKRTGDRCCMRGSTLDCNLRIQVRDLLSSGEGLAIQTTGQASCTLDPVNTGWNTLRYVSNGYQLNVSTQARRDRCVFPNRGLLNKIGFFLEPI